MDHTADFFNVDTPVGYYRIWHAEASAPKGPFDSIPELAADLKLTDYPSDGYIVHFDGRVVGSVPSLNPDDLYKPPMNDVRLYYKGDDDDQHDVKLTTQARESEVIVVAGVVVEGEQIDLVGLDRIVDDKTGAVSYNVGIWFDQPSDHEGSWQTIYTIDADMVQRRLAARQALLDADDEYEGPFQPPMELSA